jgi:hypothetical protein
MKTIDWTARPDQLDAAVVAHVTTYAPVLEAFCNGAKAEVSLINAVQVYCYADTRIMKSFLAIIKVLYNTDCISDQAIIYWHQKGAKPQGKQHFLKATEALVKVGRTRVSGIVLTGSSSKSRTRTRKSNGVGRVSRVVRRTAMSRHHASHTSRLGTA